MKHIKTFVSFINESMSSQARLDYFRKYGAAPDNQPMTSKYVLAVLLPGKNFVDFSGDLVDGPYYLKYKGNERSIYIFDKVELETGKVVGEVDVQRGNLAKLRKIYGEVKYQEK